MRESKWGLRIISEHEETEKIVNNYVEILGDIRYVSRFINTFSPKKGHRIVNVEIVRLQKLV